jgi:hypothetical protein
VRKWFRLVENEETFGKDWADNWWIELAGRPPKLTLARSQQVAREVMEPSEEDYISLLLNKAEMNAVYSWLADSRYWPRARHRRPFRIEVCS